MRVFLLVIILFVGCKTPSNPIGIKIIDEWHYETIDACRGIDISDGVLVAAASSNGYFRFNINDADTLDLVSHIPDINPNVGDDAAYDVLISNNINDFAFILDDVDGIIIDFFDDSPSETLQGCGNSLLYRSLALNDEIQDTTILFTLQKHFAELPADFDTYSTSVGIRKFYDTELFGDTYFTEEGCNAIINPNIEAMKIFYSDSLLSIADGGLGVQIYKYNHNSTNPLEEWATFYVQGGEASSLYSIGNSVIGGFDNDRGCYMALLDTNGDIISNLTFADGYSINAIDYSAGILVLAAGDDGVIIYDWNESLNLTLRGILNTGNDNYVYDVHIYEDNIYVASENGISIYKIGI